MSNFEGMPKEELGSFEAGSQVGIERENESYYDETLDQAVDALKAKGHYRIPDVINRLDGNRKATKEKLSQALNMSGLDWKIFDTLVTNAGSEKAVSDMLVSWAEEVELAADNAAIQKADQALAQKIESL